VIGIISYWLGYGVAFMFGVAPGPAVVVTLTAIFLIILVSAPRYGLVADWVRKRQMIPQTIIEDVLGSILKTKEAMATEFQLVEQVNAAKSLVLRAIRSLVWNGLLIHSDGHLALTENGRREAIRIRRAHRLWETYLERAGTPESELHATAHVLEHVNDQAALDYLDDKLGHPIQDPHGSEIPQDDLDLYQHQQIVLSKLRQGHRAKVVSVGLTAQRFDIDLGEILEIGPRLNDGKTWTVTKSNRSTVKLNHEEADAISVEVVG